jgi:ribosome-binding protein aMBF1 (putative translation factor)
MRDQASICEARMSRSNQNMRPGARIDAAIEVLRAEAMQAVADAAMHIKKTSQLSMREMITDERARLNLSLKEVADRAGITKSHMWELEQGRAVNPTVRTVHGLARALGIPFVSMAAGAMNDTEQA